jgi:hypothetical protein
MITLLVDEVTWEEPPVEDDVDRLKDALRRVGGRDKNGRGR